MRVLVIRDLCCQTVSAGRESSDRMQGLDLLSVTATSDLLLDGLSDAQRAAITHRGERLIVRGGAGSGKTRVIETRFAWLVAQGHRPERVCLLAPSGARATASRERLETVLELGYDQLFVITPPQLAALVLRTAGAAAEELSAGDRLAMLVARIDELSLEHHDFGGRPNTLLGGFVRRIDRLKAELVGPEEYRRWADTLQADSPEAALEHEFAEIYATHERMLAETGARDAGDLIIDALSLARRRPALARRFAHLLIDDAQELDLAPARLALEIGRPGLTVAGDPNAALRRFRAAGAARMASFDSPSAVTISLTAGRRCPERILRAAQSALDAGGLAEARWSSRRPPGASSSFGGAPTTARRPRRSRSRSSGCWHATSPRARSRCWCQRARSRAKRSRSRSRNARSRIG